MATYADFKKLIRYLGIDDDCPICGCSWPMCIGMCITHKSMNGLPGPFHNDYSDDCPECKREVSA